MGIRDMELGACVTKRQWIVDSLGLEGPWVDHLGMRKVL
jgi:hypothetical protein